LGQLKAAEAGWRIATESKYAYDRRPHFGKLEKTLGAAAADNTTVTSMKDDRRKSMKKFVMVTALAAVSFGAPVSIAAADEVPTYDVRKSCKVDLQSYSTAQTNSGCLADEQNARATLVSQWTQYTPESRSRCSSMVGNVAGPQSYVELLTCLQMAKDVKGLPKE
jgi:hypothetical protein